MKPNKILKLMSAVATLLLGGAGVVTGPAAATTSKLVVSFDACSSFNPNQYASGGTVFHPVWMKQYQVAAPMAGYGLKNSANSVNQITETNTVTNSFSHSVNVSLTAEIQNTVQTSVSDGLASASDTLKYGITATAGVAYSWSGSSSRVTSMVVKAQPHQAVQWYSTTSEILVEGVLVKATPGCNLQSPSDEKWITAVLPADTVIPQIATGSCTTNNCPTPVINGALSQEEVQSLSRLVAASPIGSFSALPSTYGIPKLQMVVTDNHAKVPAADWNSNRNGCNLDAADRVYFSGFVSNCLQPSNRVWTFSMKFYKTT